MFEGWENFYILIGSAAGALIGLLFVVVTLTGGLDRDRALRGASLFMTPTVVMFATVLLTGAIATVPALPALAARALIGAVATGGILYGIWIIVGFRRNPDTAAHWTDIWFYAVAPTAAFACLDLADALVWAAPKLTPYGVATVAIAMLLIGIRNAWDLITWIAPQGKPTSEG